MFGCQVLLRQHSCLALQRGMGEGKGLDSFFEGKMNAEVLLSTLTGSVLKEQRGLRVVLYKQKQKI